MLVSAPVHGIELDGRGPACFAAAGTLPRSISGGLADGWSFTDRLDSGINDGGDAKGATPLCDCLIDNGAAGGRPATQMPRAKKSAGLGRKDAPLRKRIYRSDNSGADNRGSLIAAMPASTAARPTRGEGLQRHSPAAFGEAIETGKGTPAELRSYRRPKNHGVGLLLLAVGTKGNACRHPARWSRGGLGPP